MAQFLLVHGGLHGAWCWTKVIPLLKARGHEVAAFDLPGLGDDPTPPGQTTLNDYGDAVVRAARAMGGAPILVGHSMGGMAISDAAEKDPDCASKLIYLTALMLPNGATLASSGIDLGIPLIISEDGLTSMVSPETGAHVFYNDCSDADIAFAQARLKPQALSIFGATMQLSDARFGRLPRAYIECAKDNAVSLDVQRAMVRRLPVQAVASLDSGHSPFFSMPERLADVLHELA